MKKLIGYSMLVCVAALYFVFAGCNLPASRPPLVPPMMTDVTPIAKRLPKLSPLTAVRWTSMELPSRDSRISPPVHATYRLRGYAVLEKSKAAELADKYQWQKMPPAWYPDFFGSGLNLGEAQWLRDDGFTQDFKPKEIPGALFFERTKGVVYFDLEVE